MVDEIFSEEFKTTSRDAAMNCVITGLPSLLIGSFIGVFIGRPEPGIIAGVAGCLTGVKVAVDEHVDRMNDKNYRTTSPVLLDFRERF